MKGLKFSAVVAQFIIIPNQNDSAGGINARGLYQQLFLFVSQSFNGV
jgi:hypothetical protein